MSLLVVPPYVSTPFLVREMGCPQSPLFGCRGSHEFSGCSRTLGTAFCHTLFWGLHEVIVIFLLFLSSLGFCSLGGDS